MPLCGVIHHFTAKFDKYSDKSRGKQPFWEHKGRIYSLIWHWVREDGKKRCWKDNRRGWRGWRCLTLRLWPAVTSIAISVCYWALDKGSFARLEICDPQITCYDRKWTLSKARWTLSRAPEINKSDQIDAFVFGVNTTRRVLANTRKLSFIQGNRIQFFLASRLAFNWQIARWLGGSKFTA